MPNTTEHRYSEFDGTYLLESWGEDRKFTERGLVAKVPDWLKEIITIAKIGNFFIAVNSPPPDRILWFVTTDSDKGHELKSFTTFNNEISPTLGYQHEFNFDH